MNIKHRFPAVFDTINAHSSEKPGIQGSDDCNFIKCMKKIGKLALIVLCQFNIKSIIFLASQVSNNSTVLLMTEAKFEGTFPTNQFLLN